MSCDGRRDVLWLTPDKPADISVGRRRIADYLREGGWNVTLRGTTVRTVFESLRERAEYDIVVGTTRAGAIAGAAMKLLGTPFVVDHIDPIRQFAEIHSWPLSLAVRLAENAAFALADHVLYVYDEERDRVRRYARAESQTDLGVAYDRFADPDSALVADARDRLAAAGVGADERVAIYVGGLEPLYHIEELLGAMDHLDDWTLVVLGAGSLKIRVERAARECGNVIFLGTVEHSAVPGYLHAADVGVSLVDDPHTLKVLEYAATGLSVVQARGRAEDRFGEYVEFCEPTPDDIARAVREAGEHGTNEAFREYVEQFDYERVAAEYARVLETVA
jgi:glycosyltransferase involved in cell wall biosynthesis